MTTGQTLWVGWLIVAIGAAYVVTDEAVTIDPGEGRWNARLQGDRVRIDLRFASLPFSSRATFDVPLDDLQGLDRADLERGAGERPVSFRLSRDAGTIVFDGQGGRRPSGTYGFEPDPGFVRALNRIGDSFPEDAALFRLVVHDVGIALVQGLDTLGYDDLDAWDLVRVAARGIDLDFIEAMQELGYRPEIDDLVRLRVHGVTADTAARYEALGLTGIPVDDLIRLEEHGLGPDEVRAMADAGIDPDDVDGLIRLHTHGVDPEYIAGMAALGYDSERELVKLKTHGVEVESVHALHRLGYDDLDVEELVRLQTHGITPDFVRRLEEAGHTDLSVEELVRIRTRGLEDSLAER